MIFFGFFNFLICLISSIFACIPTQQVITTTTTTTTTTLEPIPAGLVGAGAPLATGLTSAPCSCAQFYAETCPAGFACATAADSQVFYTVQTVPIVGTPYCYTIITCPFGTVVRYKTAVATLLGPNVISATCFQSGIYFPNQWIFGIALAAVPPTINEVVCVHVLNG